MTRDKGGKNMKRVSGRAWAFIVYPESLPADWEDIIIQTGLPFAISPLHNKDVNPDGEIKKPHYHCICYYENPTTLNNVKTNVCDKLNGTIPQKLESMRGMYRYHIHIDNPEKYQYKDCDRKLYNGFDVDLCNKLTRTETLKYLITIYEFCRDNDISEFYDLVNLLAEGDNRILLEVISFNTLPIKTFLESKRYIQREIKKNACKNNIFNL